MTGVQAILSSNMQFVLNATKDNEKMYFTFNILLTLLSSSHLCGLYKNTVCVQTVLGWTAAEHHHVPELRRAPEEEG